MEELSSSNINQKNDNKKIISFNEFDYILSYLIIISDKIKELIRNAIIKNKTSPNEFLFNKNCLFEFQNKSIKTVTKKEIEKIKKDNNNLIIILIRLIIINLFCQIKCNTQFNLFYFQYSKITLKIKGIGDNYILGKKGYYTFASINYLKNVIINGNIQDTIEYNYYFNLTDNFVELILDEDLTNCEYMLYGCSKITEIDLSYFNTSQIKVMKDMFSGCSSLTSIYLYNLDTSQVTDMYGMFKECSSLTSLNLSNFNMVI